MLTVIEVSFRFRFVVAYSRAVGHSHCVGDKLSYLVVLLGNDKKPSLMCVVVCCFTVLPFT